MTRTPQASNESGVAGSTTTDTGASLPASEAWLEEPAGRSEAFLAGVEEIRRRYGSDTVSLIPRLENLLRRRLAMAHRSAGTAVLSGLTGIGIRLALALLVSALAGHWAGIPWGRWAVVLAFYGLLDASQNWRMPPPDAPLQPWQRRTIEGWTALLPTIERESDLRDLTEFTRSWDRLTVAAPVGVVVATLMLGAGWLVTPASLNALHAGSLALLALLLYDFGKVVYSNLFWWALVARESRYDHRLFWASPADSPEIQEAMRTRPIQSRGFGMWTTVTLVLTVVVVSWNSPLLVPLAVGFILMGYLTTIGSALGDRASVRKIVERARHQQLDELQRRIQPYRSRYAELAPLESEQLRSLIDLHNMIRDAPATSTTHSLWRAAAGLVLPTIAFVITVFGEVSAERFLDALLP